MRFLRVSAPPVRAVLTAGSLIGAEPPSLSPEEQHLLKAQTRRSFTDVLDRATADEANLILIAGGMFARPKPALDDVRFASRCLQRMRDAGIPVLVLDESDEQTRDDATGVAFLEELGLVASVSRHGPTRSRTVEAAGVAIDVRSDRGGDGAEAAAGSGSLRITLASDPQILELWSVAANADLVVLGDLPEPARQRISHATVVRPGWSAPAVDERRAKAGFALADLDHEGVLEVEFQEIVGASSIAISFRAEDFSDGDPAATIRERLAPLVGDAALVTLEFVGPFPRELWHRCRVGDLSRRASAAGTLVSIDLSRIDVPTGPSEGATTRSFQVEVRRAAERMGGDTASADAGAIRRARKSVVDGFRRQRAMRPA